VSRADLAKVFADLDARVGRMATRERLEGELWRAFRAWWGWDRPRQWTRRGGHRRYQFRRAHCAAAYLGVSYRTVARSIYRERPTTAVVEGLAMLPYPMWTEMDERGAERHARMRMNLWTEPQTIRHGDARRLAADWRRQWDSRAADGRTARELVHWFARRAAERRRTA
jgi:hypothetical protein